MPEGFDLDDLIAETLATAPPVGPRRRRGQYSVIALVPIPETHNPFDRKDNDDRRWPVVRQNATLKSPTTPDRRA